MNRIFRIQNEQMCSLSTHTTICCYLFFLSAFFSLEIRFQCVQSTVYLMLLALFCFSFFMLFTYMCTHTHSVVFFIHVFFLSWAHTYFCLLNVSFVEFKIILYFLRLYHRLSIYLVRCGFVDQQPGSQRQRVHRIFKTSTNNNSK